MRIPITNDKRQPGIAHLGDKAPVFEMVDFDAVFDREYSSDVHFVTYTVREPDGQLATSPIPRIKKVALNSIREAGGEVVVVALALDMDLQDQPGTEEFPLDDSGKPTWTTAGLESFHASLADIDGHLASRNIAPPLVYTTNHGARFVHRLTKPVVAEAAEDLLRGIQRVYADFDIALDPLCDWTRLFRAPKVKRDGIRTSEQRWWFLRGATVATDPAAIDPISKAGGYSDNYASVRTISADKPTPEQAHALLMTEGEKGVLKTTAMNKLAAKILKGTDCYPPIFDGRPLAPNGERDSTLIRLVGQAVTHLLGPQADGFAFTPEDIYALFLAPVEDLDPDTGTPDWTESLWRKVCSCYEKERAKLEFLAKERVVRREAAARESRTMLEVVSETCLLPELHSEDEVEAQNALRRLMVICEPSGRFRALRPDGSYSNIPVGQSRLHSLVRTARLEEHVPLWTVDKNGEPRPIPEMQIAREATDIIAVEGNANIQRSHLSGESWDSLTLHLRLYARNEYLTPEFDAEVDEWLEVLTDEPASLRRWLSRALEFEGGPICALSLAGAAGAGKGLLSQGLVETLERPVRADKSVLVGRFNDSLRHTPFLVVDEGLPTGRHDIADTFRSLTAGEPMLVEEKYQTPILVCNPMRIVFTANNTDVVEQLTSHRMNTAEDQAALALRVMHLNVLPKATQLLNARGGREYTEGWVRGAGGSPSTFKLAKHLLWLYANREQFGARDKRLLVEGRADAPVIQGMRIAGQVPEAIARSIVTACENPVAAGVRQGMAISQGHLYVTASAIVEQHRMLQESNVSLTATKVGMAMRNLLGPGADGQQRIMLTNVAGEAIQQRWWDVDVLLLWNYAEAAGYPRSQLAKLVSAQYPNMKDLGV